ncbi:MAG: MJ0042-type zinc finger domain-containing protein [Phenylobacterium sp.]
MILTCPECATSYFVEPASIPPDGRTVKCTNCGARWRAEGGVAEPEPGPDLSTLMGEPTTASSDVDPDNDLEIVASEPEPKGKIKPSAKPKRPLVGIIGIAAALLVVVGGLGAAVVFRTQVAGMVPGSAALFAAVGLPVSELGLVIEGVASKPAFQAGRPVLAISGAVRNTHNEAAAVPPIRFALVDPKGAEVASLTAEPSGENLPGGAGRSFALAMPDPPAGAHELVVAFDLAGGAPAHD